MTGLREISLVLLAVALQALPAAHGRDIDLHTFWDQRCYECHGHAGKFARESLSVTEGNLVGRHHATDLRSFLAQHHMSEPLSARVYGMLLAQASTAAVYQARCTGCHRNAADLVRDDVDVENGVLVGRKSRRPLAQFLVRHGGGLSESELTTVVGSLERIRAETTGAPIPKPETKQ